jgi:hypothetical protein
VTVRQARAERFWEYSGMSQRLSPENAHQLLVVRSMLTEAVQYASVATRLQRTTAVILLDGVVERATHMVVVARGIEVKRDGLPELVAKVRQSLGEQWTPHGLVETRALHRARNSAQHEGLGPDRDDLPNWVRGTRAYVRSLVTAEYSIDIEQVAMTDVIADSDMRRLLEAAQSHVDGGDYDRAIRHAAGVVQRAEARWVTMQGLHPRPMALSRANFQPIGELRQALEDTGRIHRLSAFASSVAEAYWFQQVMTEPDKTRSPLTIDDATRTLAFATNWVIGYEAAAETWIPDRIARNERAQRMQRPQREAHAYVDRITDATLDSAMQIAVTFRIGNVPTNFEFDGWRHRVSRTIGPNWRISNDGTAQTTVRDEAGVDLAFNELSVALAATEETRAAREWKRVEQLMEAEAGVSGFAQEFQAWSERPEWLLEATLNLDGTQVVVRFDRQASGSTRDDRLGLSALQALFVSDSRVQGCNVASSERTITFRPAIAAQVIIEVIESHRNEADQIIAECAQSWQEAEAAVQRVLARGAEK